MKEERKVPKLRFPGFTDDWEQRKLGDILKEYSNKSIEEDEYKVLSSTNTGMEYREGRVSGTSNKGYKILEVDTLVLSPQNLWLGNINLNDLEKGLVSPSYKTFSLNKVNSKFLKCRIRSPRMLEQYKQASTQGASVVRRNLDMDLFKEIPLRIPNKEEQEAIGAFFSKLDETITLHQRKLENIKNLKKSLLQKMFPKNGSNVPEIRFPGFTDPWEQRKLGEIGEVEKKSINPFEKPGEYFLEYSMPAFDDGMHPHLVLGKSMLSSRLKISGSVLLVNKLNVRQKRIWLVSNAENNAVASGEFLPYKSDNIDLEFLRQLFLSDNVTRDLESISSGTSNSQKRITPSDFNKYEISFGSIAEQKKIGELLSTIDKTITLHQRKLDNLQLLKKGLLQQMFV